MNVIILIEMEFMMGCFRILNEAIQPTLIDKAVL